MGEGRVERESSDEELMTEYASEQSAAAFSELYRRYESRLYGFFLRRLSPELRTAAPDLFQKTWLKVHRARGQFDRNQKFAPWLFSVALNTLRDEWRVPRIVRQIGDELDDPPDLKTGANSDDAEQRFDLKQDMARLENALLKIPEIQREALILAEWEGFTSRELATTLGISEAAARQTVSRARKKVRLLMKEGQN